MTRSYEWQRYWCPRTGTIRLSREGFLEDPGGNYGRALNPDLATLVEISHYRCLALLGEPGIGKSTTLQTAYETADREASAGSPTPVQVNLRAVSEEAGLRRRLVENAEIRSWADGDGDLVLLLDSLDECAVHYPQIAAALVETLRELPLERLRLRIACRTADWPASLERDLKNVFGADHFGVYELAPLTQGDVELAARTEGLDAGAFLREIVDRGVGPLAAKPITLEFLIHAYRTAGTLPATQAQLYEEGCLRLCEEMNESRRSSRATGELTADERLAIATRIAAVMQFGNRDAIWTGPDRGDVPANDVTVRALSGQVERIGGTELHVTEDGVRESLSTGLFSSRGPNRLGFAHQSYAEFLAALYLRRRGLRPEQAMDLLSHPDGHVVPQLHTVAAWAATLDPRVFDAILATDPHVLLRADTTEIDPNRRAALTEAILEGHDRGTIPQPGPFMFHNYERLRHPGLADQLRPWLRRGERSARAREEAIDVAGACRVEDLADELAAIALDTDEEINMRAAAAFAVARLESESARRRLHPLAVKDVPEDGYDRLKGIALEALWPNLMSLVEVLNALTAPKRGADFYGPYQDFLSHSLPQGLTAGDLPVALEWARENGLRMGVHPGLAHAADAILLRAWDELDQPGVPTALARATLARLDEQHATIDRPFDAPNPVDDPERRRTVLRTIVQLPDDVDPFHLVHVTNPLARGEDVTWMAKSLTEANSTEERVRWARLIRETFDLSDPEHVNAVLEAADHSPELRSEFAPLLGHVDVESSHGRQLKARYLRARRKHERRERRLQKRETRWQPTGPIVAVLLDQAESGDLDAFWKLNLCLCRKPDGSPGAGEHELDITALPGWEAADQATRQRIVETAKQYILNFDPRTEDWPGPGHRFRPADAGYRALLLLRRVAPDFIEELSDAVWRKWTPSLVGITVLHHVGTDEEIEQELLALSQTRAPKEFTSALLRCIKLQVAKNGTAYRLHAFQDRIDGAISREILALAKDPTVGPYAMESLLGPLLGSGSSEAAEFARSLIAAVPSTQATRSRRAVAARLLLSHQPVDAWPAIWEAIGADAEFGDAVLGDAADSRSLMEGIARLPPVALADLFVWLWGRVQVSVGESRSGFPSSNEQVASRILDALVKRGTMDAVDALRSIAQRFPDQDRFVDRVQAAEAARREQTWKPFAPAEILALDGPRNNRLVESAHQLQEVVMESLERIQGELIGEIPAARLLWDTREPPRPKGEEELSDYLARELRKDLESRGVIVNREVQIRRGGGARRGERTDIHVDAIVPGTTGGGHDRVTVVIEVKGCWHDEVMHAMKTQLADRYLAESRTRHGIYVVGWFLCDAWTDDDRRKGRTRQMSLEDARQTFGKQARDLSRDGPAIRSVVLDLRLR